MNPPTVNSPPAALPKPQCQPGSIASNLPSFLKNNVMGCSGGRRKKSRYHKSKKSRKSRKSKKSRKHRK